MSLASLREDKPRLSAQKSFSMKQLVGTREEAPRSLLRSMAVGKQIAQSQVKTLKKSHSQEAITQFGSMCRLPRALDHGRRSILSAVYRRAWKPTSR